MASVPPKGRVVGHTHEPERRSQAVGGVEDLLHGPIVEPEVLLEEEAGEKLRRAVETRREPARPVGRDPLRHRQSQPRETKKAVVHAP
jgi:hypothetical protein